MNVILEKKDYGNIVIRTVQVGHSFSIILHPEHWNRIYNELIAGPKLFLTLTMETRDKIKVCRDNQAITFEFADKIHSNAKIAIPVTELCEKFN